MNNALRNVYLSLDLIKFKVDRFLSSRERNKGSLSDQKTVPKIIHYAWFGGGGMSALCHECMATWSKVMPDWKIMLWNEDNFPMEKFPYVEDAIKRKCWAYVSDVARLYAVHQYGSVYMDTDVEVLRPFDDLLMLPFFTCYEAPTQVTMSTFGSVRGHPCLGMLLEWYKTIRLRRAYIDVANVRFVSKLVRSEYGVKLDGKELHLKDGSVIFPREYFSPKPLGNGRWGITENTYSVHRFNACWY